MTTSKEVLDIIQGIQEANKIDELKIIDDILAKVKQGRLQPFDIIYVDLALDRSTSPLKITGSGTFIMGVEASDDTCNLSIGFPGTESDANKRITLKDGKRIFLPFNEFYIYHSAQAGKYMKLLRGREMPSLKMGVEDDSGESSNSDLVTALGNGSTFTTAQVAVDTTAGGVQIADANTLRKRITIKVPETASVPVFIRRLTGVTTSNGHRLAPGDSLTLNNTASIFGIVSAGSVTVTTLEE